MTSSLYVNMERSNSENNGGLDSSPKDVFREVGRTVYLEVNLDFLLHNIDVLKGRCKNKNIGVIAVVKAGAYGHGSVKVSHHLKGHGVERLAVATVDEGIHLRKHHVAGPLHVFGNVLEWEMGACVQHSLIPTVCSTEAVDGMAEALREHTPDAVSQVEKLPVGCVHIKIDSGMSRNGCQPSDLAALVEHYDELGVRIEGMMTHFADSWGDPRYTQQQLDTFLAAVQPFRSRKLKLHVANTGAVLNDFGTDLDFIRPGISIYGLPPGDGIEKFANFGFRPIGSIKIIPTLVKQLSRGTKVGYSMTYKVEQEHEWIATFPIGYADGYWRHFSSTDHTNMGCVVRNKTGEKCPVVGRVSMDAITVRLPSQPDPDEVYTLLTADFDRDTSASGMAEQLGTIAYEVMTRQSCRLARIYKVANQDAIIVHALASDAY